MEEVGYDENTISQVKDIIMKKGLKSDPEVQCMEDALCLTFLEHEIETFAQKHADEKMISIIAKTWGKMSEKGHAEALKLQYNDHVGSLIQKALGNG